MWGFGICTRILRSDHLEYEDGNARITTNDFFAPLRSWTWCVFLLGWIDSSSQTDHVVVGKPISTGPPNPNYTEEELNRVHKKYPAVGHVTPRYCRVPRQVISSLSEMSLKRETSGSVCLCISRFEEIVVL